MKFRSILAIFGDFRPKSLGIALFGAILFSLFIYLHHFGITSPLLYSLLALLALAFYLKLPRQSGFAFGFWVGIAWFYWMALSFRYYELTYLIPFILLGIGGVYGVLFSLALYLKNPLVRALLLWLLSHVQPFGFDWMVPEVMLVPSLLGSSKLSFGLILLSLSLFWLLPQRWLKPLPLLLLPFALYSKPLSPSLPPFEVEIIETHIPQEIRWEREARARIIEENLKRIDAAILEGKALILFPETAFPLLLNKEDWVLERLAQKSQEIAIITGALRAEEGEIYNSTYFFHQGRIEVADKIVLVPFGEKIPLPDFLVKPLNRLFFGGAQDYRASASKPVDFELHGVKLRNAICYEATSAILYEGSPQFMVVGSNNAWFYPSIEPALQRLLLGYYAREHRTIILHATNRSPSGIIAP